MPIISVSAKPFTGPMAIRKIEMADTKVTTSASTLVHSACLVPERAAVRSVLPIATSSRTRSNMRIDVSAARPTVRAMPAMPGSDNANWPSCDSVASTPR